MQAGAGEVEIPAAITGYVELFLNDSSCSKYLGNLRYGHRIYTHADWIDHAFLKFGLGSLPDTCVILSGELDYYQYEHAEGLPQVDIRLIEDPGPLSAHDIYFDIEHARAITNAQVSQDGWLTWAIDTELLDSCHHAGWVSFGVHFDGPQYYGYWANAYGCGQSLPPYLRIVYVGPNECDIQAVRAELATYPLVARASQRDTALFVLTNSGMVTSNYFWAYVASPGLAPESTRVQPITVGETVAVRVPLPLLDTASVFVDYTLWSACPNDARHGDDTAGFSSWVFPRGTYAAEGFDRSSFPPPGWVVVNNERGMRRWTRESLVGGSHSGPAYTECLRELTINDDWLITGPVCPKKEDRDTVGFYIRSNYPDMPETLEVWTMRGQQVGDTVAHLRSTGAPNTAYNRKTVPLDTADGDTVYIGFRCRSLGDWNGLCLDDIWFSSTYVPGTNEPGSTHASQPELTFAPNPASGRFVTVRYSLPAATRGRLTLRDMLGRTVNSFTLDPSGTARLDLRGFAPGVYMAALDAPGGSVSRKLIITGR